MLLEDWVVTTAVAIYIGLLFAVAFYADRRAKAGRSLINSGAIYAFSLALYAPAWTYYGSVGHAARTGVGFLAIYLGPTLTFALGWLVLRRIIRISRRNRITSLADFVSARYGKSTRLGGLVTVIAVIGIVPFIALQLKALSNSCEIIRLYPQIPSEEQLSNVAFVQDTGLYVAFLLAAFAILFGTRHLDASERHEGMVAAIALESVVKLIIFLALGLFVTFGIFNGFGDVFGRATANADTTALLTLGQDHGYSTWIWLTVLSMLAVVLLPRQWQLTVVENVDEQHLKRAMWLFPLYLLAITLFVLPVALGGLLMFGDASAVDPDTYVLALPLAQGQQLLTLLVFIGGLSATTGVIIVETVALSTMVSNFLVMPLLLRGRSRLVRRSDLTGLILGTRRATITAILMLGYAYFRLSDENATLVSIGLVSFAAVAQFAPVVLGGLFWKGGTRGGALAGLAAGFTVWAYTLLLPSFAKAGWLPASFLLDGPFGLELLRPQELFGLTGMDEISHTMFWSMLVNIGGYVGVSLTGRPGPAARADAVRFVDVLEDPARSRRPWYGRVTVGDLWTLVERFLGPRGARKALRAYSPPKQGADASPTEEASPELVEYVESLLVGAIGAACARFVIASVTEEDPLHADTMREILDEASQVAALEERQRLAHELHDSVSQALFSMTLRTRALEMAIQQDGWDRQSPVATGLTELRNLVQSALTEMRALIFQLRPGALQEEGLTAAVRKHAAAVAAREGLDIRVHAPDDRLPLDDRAEQDLFRVIQEALHNSVKHAHPGRVDIRLHEDAHTAGTLIVEIADDGVGFSPEESHPGHLGLDGMRERAERLNGRLTVDSSPAGSTVVRAELPGLLRRRIISGLAADRDGTFRPGGTTGG